VRDMDGDWYISPHIECRGLEVTLLAVFKRSQTQLWAGMGYVSPGGRIL